MISKAISTFWRYLTVVLILLLASPVWATEPLSYCSSLLAPIDGQTPDQNFVRLVRLYSKLAGPNEGLKVLRRVHASTVAINPFSPQASRIEIQFRQALEPVVTTLDKGTWKLVLKEVKIILKEQNGNQTDREEKQDATSVIPVFPTTEAEISIIGDNNSRPSVITTKDGRHLIALGTRIRNGMVASEPNFEIYEFNQVSSKLELLLKFRIEESVTNTTAYPVFTKLFEKFGKLFLVTAVGFEMKSFEINLAARSAAETGRFSFETKAEHPVSFTETDDGQLVTAAFTDDGSDLALNIVELSSADGSLRVIDKVIFQKTSRGRVRLSPSHREPVFKAPDVLKRKDGSLLVTTAVEENPYRFFKFANGQLSEILKNNLDASHAFPMALHETKSGRAFLALASPMRNMSVYEIKGDTIEFFAEHKTCMATHGPASFYEKEDRRIFVHYMACNNVNLLELNLKKRALIEKVKLDSASESNDKRALLVPLNADFFFFLSTNDQSGRIYRYAWSTKAKFDELAKERYSGKYAPSYNEVLRTADGTIYIITMTNSAWLTVNKVARIVTSGNP